MTDLRRSAAFGLQWSTASQFFRQGVQVLTTILLARLLSPSDFGLVSMAAVVIAFVQVFGDLGTASAVIQRKHVSRDFLSSIFWGNVLFGIVVTAVVAALAPLAAAFFGDPRVASILQVLSLGFLAGGLGSVQKAVMERDLAFRRLAYLETAATAAGAVVGIWLALSGAGVWSLAWQSVATAAATTALFWFGTRWRPGWIFRWPEVRSVSSYSLHLTGFNVLNYFARNADYILIGRFLGAVPLGYYTLAYRIMFYPLQNISTVVGRVALPLFSRIQEDDGAFRSGYVKANCGIALAVVPMMLGLWALAEPAVLLLFGPRWAPVVPLVLILAPIGMLQSVGSTVGTIYQVKGRTDLMLRWGIGAGALAVFSFAVGLRWGVVGVAASYAVASLLLAYPNFAIPFRLIGLGMGEFLA
ncbi:MAG: rane protein involved in the export of O-antigen and teichoic acid, partial [Deltaproteobacteria bacterium]|nr:rane protein involved in the export of O-antigen and teichoic acid [Deltaproteobacteria bacterium]